jgi:DNA-binding phage protein
MMKTNERTNKILKRLAVWCARERGRQQQVARWLGASRVEVYRWLRGRTVPSSETILAIQEFLELVRQPPHTPTPPKRPRARPRCRAIARCATSIINH